MTGWYKHLFILDENFINILQVSILNHTQLQCNCYQRTVIRQDTWQKIHVIEVSEKLLHEAKVLKLGKCLFISEVPFFKK